MPMIISLPFYAQGSLIYDLKRRRLMLHKKQCRFISLVSHLL